MPRTWREPIWLKEQKEIALERGYAYVRDYGGSGFARLIWRNTFKAKTQEDRDCIFELEIDDKVKKHKFDSQEFQHWMKYV